MANKPNKHFAVQLERFHRARKPGTPEWAKRLDYPGPAARCKCRDPECLNSAEPTVPRETYHICEACAARCPDPILEYYTHAPQQTVPSKAKQRAAAVMAFRGWLLAKAAATVDENRI